MSDFEFCSTCHRNPWTCGCSGGLTASEQRAADLAAAREAGIQEGWRQANLAHPVIDEVILEERFDQGRRLGFREGFVAGYDAGVRAEPVTAEVIEQARRDAEEMLKAWEEEGSDPM